MPIHFACKQCGKALFAQDRYAGQAVLCPACNTRSTIPAPTPPEAPATSDRPAPDSTLIDMEKGPAGAAPQTPAPSEATPVAPAEIPPNAALGCQPGTDPGAPFVESAPATPAQAAPVSAAEPTKHCPICAETIKAAAKKCRFCGATLDPELRAQEESERQMSTATVIVSQAEHSVRTWRTISAIVCGLTIGWLFLVTLGAGRAPNGTLLIIFNFLLMTGLFWSVRQMRNGPHQVFLSAAMAVLLCMPLNVLLGLPVTDPESQKLLLRQHPEMFPKEMSEEDVQTALRTMSIFAFLFVGFLFSIPVWIAAFKVAALQRLKATLGNNP